MKLRVAFLAALPALPILSGGALWGRSVPARSEASEEERLVSVCPTPARSWKALCACLDAVDDERLVNRFHQKSACRVTRDGAAEGRLGVLAYGNEGAPSERAHFLFAREGGGVRLLVELGRDYEPGALGIQNQADVKPVSVRAVGARSVAIVTTVQSDSKTDIDGLEVCTHVVKSETLCALGPKVACTPPIPIEVESDCGPGTEEKAIYAYTIGLDGHVRVTLLSGPPDALPLALARGFDLW